jgi:hypothetical protein
VSEKLSGYVEDDPDLIESMRAHAMESAHAAIWLLNSARVWAQREFTRRAAMGLGYSDTDLMFAVDEMIGEQCAVLTEHLVLVGERRKEWTSHVGLLLRESTTEYVQMDYGRGSPMGGMMEVIDVMPLADQFKIEGWTEIKPSWEWRAYKRG